MFHTIVSKAAWFVALLLLQALVFNRIHILGYATPMPYVFFLLILPSYTPRWLYLVLGFLLGLSIDLFTNTPGIAAASMTVVGLITPWLIKLFGPKDYDENDSLEPGARTMEWGPFLRYTFTATLVHCLLFFCIEAFNFFRPADMLINILSSTVLTFLFIAAFELIRNRTTRKQI